MRQKSRLVGPLYLSGGLVQRLVQRISADKANQITENVVHSFLVASSELQVTF